MSDEQFDQDYPLDYGEYLFQCYDVNTGNVRVSYAEWKELNDKSEAAQNAE